MKILKKRGVVEKRGEEETKSMPHVPVVLPFTLRKVSLKGDGQQFHQYR